MSADQRQEFLETIERWKADQASKEDIRFIQQVIRSVG